MDQYIAKLFVYSGQWKCRRDGKYYDISYGLHGKLKSYQYYYTFPFKEDSNPTLSHLHFFLFILLERGRAKLCGGANTFFDAGSHFLCPRLSENDVTLSQPADCWEAHHTFQEA